MSSTRSNTETATPQVGVAIVAPGGYAPDPSLLPAAIDRLAAQGCRVTNYTDHCQRDGRFGAIDSVRVAQLHAAACNPDIDIIMALRAGYGMSRLLPLLDLDMLAASGKRLVGHSDFTALHLALLAQAGTVSFAGPMICDDYTRADTSDFTMTQFWSCLNAHSHRIDGKASDNPRVEARGTLWGGNLAMVVHLIGTPYFPDIDNGILFLEDINEHPFRIERMLLQLLHAGILQRQRAIVLGDFSGYRLSEYDNGYDFTAMLTYMRQQTNVPIVTGLPFGHIRDKVTLAVGSSAELITNPDGFWLNMQDY
ncbi:MAG: muramoyltetrapeptide carboxypeptidase [Herminiimonas sp.]|nr:muramoyltetrapeptide carboxypeptidase [Herminiimonas sp.]